MDEKTNKAPEKGWNGPVRRVGSLTLGVCLIASGVLFLCYFFLPGFNWQLAVKIAPAAGLILLGCEVLYFAAKPQRWKYDFLSVLLCLVLMTACFGAGCLMMAFDAYTREPEEYWQSDDVQDDWEDSAPACGRIWTTAPARIWTRKTRCPPRGRPRTGRSEPYRTDMKAIRKIPFTDAPGSGIL